MSGLVFALPVPAPQLALACLVTLIAATAQGTLGFGFAVLSVPILALIDPVLAPVPQLLVVGPLTVAAFWREREAADLRGVGWVIGGRVPGVAMAAVLLKIADPRVLDLMLASFVLFAVAVLASGVSLPQTRWTKAGAGFLSGLLSVISSIGGPPLALLYRRERGATIRATLGAIFTIGLVMTIGARLLVGAISSRDVWVALWLLPALLLGLRLSGRLTSVAEGRPLRVGILVLSAAAALGLIVRTMLEAN